jgi:RNA polymerase primary sigma factor
MFKWLFAIRRKRMTATRLIMARPQRFGREDSLDSLDQWMRPFAKDNNLSDEEVTALMPRVREGDNEAIDTMIRAYRRYVVSVVRNYQQFPGADIKDLVQEGNKGLWIALQKFDETKGVKFTTYSVNWIRQAALQYLAEQTHSVRVPPGYATRLNKARKQLEARRAEAPNESVEESISRVIEQSDLDEDSVRRSWYFQNDLRLDRPVSSDNDRSAYESFNSSSAVNGSGLEQKLLSEDLELALAKINPEDAKVLKLYYGLEGDGMTLEEIGSAFGVTRERVRQRKERGLEKLRAQHSLGAWDYKTQEAAHLPE